MSKVCNVCQNKLGAPVYSTTGDISITSLCELIPFSSHVYYCQSCGHTQTSPLDNVEEYYSENYKILVDSEEEDQIITFPDGRKEFRFELQAKTFFNKVNISSDAKILDYGCAKSTTLKRVCEKKKDITPYLFDVSEIYIPFWSTFVKPENWATFEPKDEWRDSFDVITSFFSLEHVSEPVEMMHNIHALLKDEGLFYCIVPNTFVNTADFVVADHVNHFSAPSLEFLLKHSGFEIVEIDQEVHYGAFVIVARKTRDVAGDDKYPLTDKVNDDVLSISKYWSGISKDIKQFEQLHSRQEVVSAIYGSGFYGSFIATCLSDFERVKVFIDQNPYRQGMKLMGKSIVSPEVLSRDIQIIYVGLNSNVAKNSIKPIDSFNGLDIQFYFLPLVER